MAWHLKVAVKRGHARLIVRIVAGIGARPLREDNDLARLGQALTAIGDHLLQRTGRVLATHGDHARARGEPAKEGQPHQLLLEHVARIVKHDERRDGVEHAHMLAGDQRGT